MDILQIILALGTFGIIGGIVYWFIVVLGAGLKKTKDDINNDSNFKDN